MCPHTTPRTRLRKYWIARIIACFQLESILRSLQRCGGLDGFIQKSVRRVQPTAKHPCPLTWASARLVEGLSTSPHVNVVSVFKWNPDIKPSLLRCGIQTKQSLSSQPHLCTALPVSFLEPSSSPAGRAGCRYTYAFTRRGVPPLPLHISSPRHDLHTRQFASAARRPFVPFFRRPSTTRTSF